MKNNEDKQKLLEYLTEFPLVSVAAKKAGIDKSTVYRWRDKNKAFAKKMDQALSKGRDAVNDLAESKLINNIRQGDFKSTKYWLDNNCKRYIKPRPVNIFTNEKILDNKIKFVNFSGEEDTNKN